MSRKSARRTCEICGIKEAHLERPLFFANFPKDENRCREWVRATGNSDLVLLPIEKLNTVRHICGVHFKNKDFNRKGNRLKKRAVPCLNLSSTPLSDSQMSEFPLHMFKNQDSRKPTSTNDRIQAKASCSSEVAVSDANLCEAAAPDSYAENKIQDSRKQSASIDEKIRAVASCSSVVTASDHLHDRNEQKIKETETPRTILGISSAQNKMQTRGVDSKQNENKRKLTDDKENIGTPKKMRDTCSKSEEVEAAGVKRKLSYNEELTPRKKNLVEKLNKTKCTLKSLRRSSILIDNIKSPVLKELIINASKNENRKPKARRWTTQHKLSCLAILKRSRKTYRYLSTAVPLPTIKTLQNLLKKVPMKTGISQSVLNHLKMIAADKDEKDRVCSLVFDEMALKSRLMYNEGSDMVEGFEDLGHLGRTNELADHALVFLLQGLKQKTKQPIAFYFTKGTISSNKLAIIIKNIICEVRACGYTILNTVCDQGPTNMGALKILRETSGPYEDGSDHYFKIDGKKVYIIYDIPHLFKSIRNNFLNAGNITFNKKTAKWEHLVEMETHNKNFLYLSKITEAHINPKYRAKMRVKLAAQILSNTVAAVLKLLSRGEKSESRALDLLNSAHVIEELDQLFDLTNGPSGPHDIKKTKRQNVSEKSNHMDRWAYFIKILPETKFINKYGVQSRNVRCVEGYVTSLKSLRDIWMQVKAIGYKYLNLRNLNQDALENLFGVIRQHSPTNRNPTASHFIGAIKTSVVTGLTAPHSRGANCENDDKRLLTNFHDFVFGDTKIDNPISSSSQQEVNAMDNVDQIPPTLSLPEFEEEDVAESDFALIERQPIVYVAGYLARHILKSIDCSECQSKLVVKDPGENPTYAYILLREWWQTKFSLTYPTISFCKTIETLVSTTEKEILPRLHERNICLLACTIYAVNTPESSFACPSHGQDIAKICFRLTSKLLIRRQCQRINESLASKEEVIASINKRAEQQGKAK